MLSYLIGMMWGRKLAKETGILCKEIVNYMISHGYNLQLPDTAYVLQESYIICNFAISIRNRNSRNTMKVGSMVVFTQNALRDWLNKLFKLADPNYNFEESVNDVIAGLTPHYEEWAKELAEAHPELRGQAIDKWIPAAMAQFIEHVDYHFYERFGQTPEKFHATLNSFLTDRMRKLVA